MPNLACVLRAQSHIDQKLTLRPAEARASSGPPMDALLTSKCVKFIGSDSSNGLPACSCRQLAGNDLASRSEFTSSCLGKLPRQDRLGRRGDGSPEQNRGARPGERRSMAA